MKRYPKYKDSGIEWLEEIPEGWEVKRLKWLASLEYGSSLSEDDREEGDVPVYGSNGIVGKHSKSITGSPAIIIGRKGSYGKVSYSEAPCFPIDTTYYIDPSLTKENIRWLYYLLSSINLDEITFDTGVPGLSREFAYSKIVPVPIQKEQSTIANFLDQKTAKIDELIKKNEKLIELLKEKRQAVISHAVTKGLDPNAKMKDSRIEWIGEIPEEWKKIPIKFLAKPKKFAIKTGPFGSDLKRGDFTEQGIKIYNQQNVINNDFRLGDNYISQDKYETLISFTIYPGDLLITSRGTIGKCAILPENCDKGILHPCLIRIQVDEAKCYKKFLVYVIQNSNYFYDQLFILSNATTIDVIYGDSLSNAFVLLPSLNEQISITNYLDQKTSRIDETIKKILSQIDKLKEYRQALISNVVTGKVKVAG